MERRVPVDKKTSKLFHLFYRACEKKITHAEIIQALNEVLQILTTRYLHVHVGEKVCYIEATLDNEK
jgi:hypothetical protein